MAVLLDVATIREVFGATVAEATLARQLFENELVTHEDLKPTSNRARQIICTLRPKLKRFNIHIQSIDRRGYSMSEFSKERMRMRLTLNRETMDGTPTIQAAE